MGPEGHCSDTELFRPTTEQLNRDTSNVRAFQMVLNVASPGMPGGGEHCHGGGVLHQDMALLHSTAHRFALGALPLWIPFSLDSCAPTVMGGFAMGFPQCNTEPQLESLTSLPSYYTINSNAPYQRRRCS